MVEIEGERVLAASCKRTPTIGMKVKTATERATKARAMVMEPSILLADEPTGNLDTRSGEEIVALLERLNAGGLTLVLVTHDPRVAEHARRVLRMRDGQIVPE